MLYGDAELLKRVDHHPGVVGVEGAGESALAIGQGGHNQGAIGQTL